MAGPSYDDARETPQPGPPRPREPRIIDATIVEDHGTSSVPSHRRPPAGSWNAGPVTGPIVGPGTTAPLPRVEDPPPPGERGDWAAGSRRRAALVVAIVVAVFGGVLAIVLPRLPHPTTSLAQPGPSVAGTFGPDQVSALTGGPVVTGDPSASAGPASPSLGGGTSATDDAQPVNNPVNDQPPGAFAPVTLQAASGRLSGPARTDPTYGVVCLGQVTVALGCLSNGQGAVTLSVTVPTTGSYRVAVYYVSLGVGALQVIANGHTTEVTIGYVASQTSLTVNVALTAGVNSIQFTDAAQPGPAIHHIVVSRP